MRSVNTALSNYIASPAMEIRAIDLHSFTLIDGTAIRWSGGDVAVTWGGTTYQLGPKISREAIRLKIGLQADTLSLIVAPETTDAVGGVTVSALIGRGEFDGAAYRLDRLYLSGDPQQAAIGTALDAVPRFVGRVGAVSGGAGTWTLEIRSELARLDAPFPRNTYQPSCTAVWADGACGVNAVTYRATGTVSSVTSATQFVASAFGGSAVADYYALGRLRFTTGANAGMQRTVKASAATGNFSFSQPFPAAVSVGDQFEVWPGCDKKIATCTSKFGNRTRFRGYPLIPVAETTL